MTTAKQKVYEDTIHEVNNPHGLFEVKAMKSSLKQALQMKPRRQAILKSIEAEINNHQYPERILKGYHRSIYVS
jgi:hypothetical protein